MRIPDSNICATFYYKHYKHKIRVLYERVNGDGTVDMAFRQREVPASSVYEVPYWRIYLVKLERKISKYTWQGKTHVWNRRIRTTMWQSACNYTFDEVCDILRKLGKASTQCEKIKGTTYVYECWPRKLEDNNRKAGVENESKS